MPKSWRANAMLLIAAMIWGAAFVAQSVGMSYVGPFTFQACRCLLGGIVLLPVIALMNRSRIKKTVHKANTRNLWMTSLKNLWTSGLLCGLCLFAASSFQQVGLLYTSAGKSGFITALYVVLVPCAGLLLGKHPPLTTWCGTGLATIALWLLCAGEDFSVGKGELLTLACAVCFTIHIMLVDQFSRRVDGVKLSCIQFFVCAFLAGVAALSTETPSIPAILSGWLPISYAGILSCGVAYTFQILGQRDTKPVIASLLMSFESVFAVLFGAVILKERLTAQEYIGCALMFAAVILAQLPQKK